jgi:hypothetical protein
LRFFYHSPETSGTDGDMLDPGSLHEVAAMASAPVRSMYQERPDYRVDLLARTNVMTAWLGDSYPQPFQQVGRLAGYVAFDQDEVRVTIGKGTFTGVRP